MQGTLRALARATNNPPTLRRQCDRDPGASSMLSVPRYIFVGLMGNHCKT